MGSLNSQDLANWPLPTAEGCQVKTQANSPVDTIPPADEVRASLFAALRQVQLLRGLLQLAERKERQGSALRQRKGAPRA
jgi:hypothetical protein